MLRVIRILFTKLGVLRSALTVIAIALIALSPYSGQPVQHTGWPLFFTVLVPTFYVILLFVLPLDITMSRVFMSDKEGLERERLKLIIWVEAGLFAALVISWAPFLLRLFGVRL